MKMRRLELAVLSITLAFAFFMGGFFTGRNHSTVSIAATAIQIPQTPETGHSMPQTVQSEASPAKPPEVPEPDRDIASTPEPQQTHDIGGSGQGTGAPKETDGKININTATHGELTDLPGIGNTLASRIIDYRMQSGSFSKIEDIRNVSGIGEKRFEAIKDLITVG